MHALFWFDTVAYGILTVVAASLALMVLGAEPRRALNRFFAIFTLLEAVWACASLAMRMALWLQIGSPGFFLEVAVLSFALLGPVLLMFTVRYVDRPSRWADLVAVLGLAASAVLSIFLFRDELFFGPRLIAYGMVNYDIAAPGYVAALLPIFYLTWSAILFWLERRRTGEPFLALSAVVLLGGLVGGGLFNPPFPVMSFTTTISMAILGYGILSRQIFNPLRERTAQLATLREIGLELTAQLDLEVLLRSIVSRAVELLGAESGGLYLYRPEREMLEWVTSVGPGLAPPGSLLQRGEGLSGRVWESGGPMIVNDYEHWPGRAAVYNGYAWGAVVAVPVSWGEEFLGVLDVLAMPPQAFTQAHAELLALCAGQAAIAIRNARLYEAARRRAERLAVVNHIARAVQSTPRLDDLLTTVCQEVTSILAVDSFFVALYDEEAGELDFRLQVDEGVRQPPERQPAQIGLTSVVVAHGKPLRIADLQQETGRLPAPQLWGTMKLPRSWLGVPMQIGQRLTGVICVQSYSPGAYGEEEELLLSTIADQIAVAVEQARLYQSLRDSEEKYRTLFEQANDAVFLLTPEGRILDANQQAGWLLGYERDELQGMSIAAALPVPVPGGYPHSAQQFARGGMRVETEYARKDGRRVPVELSAVMLEIGGQRRVLAHARDISERKRAEEQFRLAQKMEAVGTLAGGVAHDFNNMLTGILGYASVAQADVPPGSPLHADLQQIMEAANRAADLTRQLLTFARRAPSVATVPVDINGVVQEVVKLLERTIDKAIAIELHLAPDLRSTQGNPGQLHQTVLNLCLNARDAMPQGGRLVIETGSVRLGEEGAPAGVDLAAGEYVLLAVSDTGQGMAPEVSEHIFEPFFTTKEQGRGLGLPIVYGIVREHGGAVHVYSEPGHGSTFRVYLPASAAAAEAPTLPVAAPPRGSETVLVVDDEASVRLLLQRILERGGYSAVLAEDGAQALQLYRQQSGAISLVVLDLIMPGLGGGEVYERLREIDPQVKVLLSSGYSQNGQAAEILAVGAVGFLQKPYNLEAVLRTVRQALDAP